MKQGERRGGEDRPRVRVRPSSGKADLNGAPTDSAPVLQLTGDAIQTVTYKFLWAPWVPFGHLTLIEGDEGVGKSLLLAKIAADVTGGPRIDGGRRRRPGRWVLYLAGEESLSGSVVPRLRAAGAVLSLVSFGPAAGAAGRCWRPELPRDMPALAQVVAQLRPGAVILEPVVSFFGRDHDWRRDQDAHAVLDPLVLLAAEFDFALLGARHWTKSGSGPALARGMGSRAVSGCTAVVIQLGRNESPAGGFAMVCPKNRLGPPIEARSYTIAPVQGGAVIRLGAPLGLRVDELQRPTSAGAASKLVAARLLLRHKLGKGWEPVADLVASAKKEGLSDAILYDAKCLDRVRHRWNTSIDPKRSEWGAPLGGWDPLD